MFKSDIVMCYNTNEFCVREPAYKFVSILAYTAYVYFVVFVNEVWTKYSYRKETIWDLREYVFFFFFL